MAHAVEFKLDSTILPIHRGYCGVIYITLTTIGKGEVESDQER